MRDPRAWAVLVLIALAGAAVGAEGAPQPQASAQRPPLSFRSGQHPSPPQPLPPPQPQRQQQQQQQQPLREVPLPYSLQDKPHPPRYAVLRAAPGAAPSVDGDLSDAAWAAARWASDFGDIIGPSGPAAWLATEFALLWDDESLYLGARMEDPALFANGTVHDSIIYFDNNLELFLDPDGDNHLYSEIEFNGLGQVWDLVMVRPYRNGGPPLMSWESIPPAVPTAHNGTSGWAPMRHAVKVDGSINAQAGTRSWQLEAAIPWALLKQLAGRRAPPKPGDAWRSQIARMIWNVTWDAGAGEYVKQPGPPFTFTWAPQYQVELHQPESWGYLVFEGQDVLAAAKAGAWPPEPEADPTWPARALLMEIHGAQQSYFAKNGDFAKTLALLPGVKLPPANSTAVRDVKLEATEAAFMASATVPPPPQHSTATFMASATVPPPPLPAAAAGAGPDPCRWPRAAWGGWVAADKPARLYVTDQGRLTLAFPGSPELRYQPSGKSRWCQQ